LVSAAAVTQLVESDGAVSGAGGISVSAIPGATALWGHTLKLKAHLERSLSYLGTRGCVYKHLAFTLKWLRVKNHNTRKYVVKDIALHGARDASRTLRRYERLTRTVPSAETVLL